MSLLTIIQDAARAIGLTPPATVVANTNEGAQQLLYFAKEELRELGHSYDWQEITKEGNFTGGAGTDTTSLPSDYQRLRSNTTWHREDNREVLFPVSSSHWAHLKGWEVATTLNRRARIRGGSVIFYDTLTASDISNIYFEYISKNLARSAGDVEKETFTADDDAPALSEHLVTLGVIWRYLQARDRDNWESAYTKYSRERDRLMSQDTGTRGLYLGTPVSHHALGAVRDSGYGS